MDVQTAINKLKTAIADGWLPEEVVEHRSANGLATNVEVEATDDGRINIKYQDANQEHTFQHLYTPEEVEEMLNA